MVISVQRPRLEMLHCLYNELYNRYIFITIGHRSGERKTVDCFEDNDYVKSERDTSSNGHHIKSRVFKNKNFDSGGGSFSNESSRFGSRNSYDRGGGRSSQPFVDDQSGHNRFSDNLVLKVNSGDIGRIIGMLNDQYALH